MIRELIDSIVVLADNPPRNMILSTRSLSTLSIIAFAALIEPCNSIELDDLPTPDLCLSILAAGTFILVACYIFYPAYSVAAGGLGCRDITLAGDRNSDGKGEN